MSSPFGDRQWTAPYVMGTPKYRNQCATCGVTVAKDDFVQRRTVGKFALRHYDCQQPGGDPAMWDEAVRAETAERGRGHKSEVNAYLRREGQRFRSRR